MLLLFKLAKARNIYTRGVYIIIQNIETKNDKQYKRNNTKT